MNENLSNKNEQQDKFFSIEEGLRMLSEITGLEPRDLRAAMSVAINSGCDSLSVLENKTSGNVLITFKNINKIPKITHQYTLYRVSKEIKLDYVAEPARPSIK